MVYHEFPYKHSHKNVGIPHFFRQIHMTVHLIKLERIAIQ